MAMVKKETIDSKSPFATSEFSKILYNKITGYYKGNYKDVVIVCVGTDRSTGDCLGPLIGHKLSNYFRRYENVHIFGTLEEPVHAKNLEGKMRLIKNSYKNPLIIAIDACLGKLERVGYVSIGEGPIKPGAGVNKKLPAVGDLHITGVVNMSGFMEYVVLQNTRLNVVMTMADVISNSLNYTMWKIFKHKTCEANFVKRKYKPLLDS
ncbi:MAG: spore protease YyaC [Firmicutes bacterium]|nr:spore protease YyaC [Bacillota bacterium]